jgi:predicted ATPase
MDLQERTIEAIELLNKVLNNNALLAEILSTDSKIFTTSEKIKINSCIDLKSSTDLDGNESQKPRNYK